MTTELEISTSPRSTWVWAPDTEATTQVRRILDEGGHWWQIGRRGRTDLPLVTDVEIGVVALDACQALAEAGFTFRWHDEQLLIDRGGWPARLPGMHGHG